MNHKTVGNNIRQHREAQHWTQEELAIVAGVDVRTIQRAECGHNLALESLRAIAGAFETTIEELGKESQEAIFDEFRDKYLVIDLYAVERATDLSVLLGAGALWFHRAGTLTDEQLDAIAELEQIVNDCGDIWRDLEPLQKRETEKELQTLLSKLTSLKVAVSAGVQTMNLRLPQLESGASRPCCISVLYVAVVPGSKPLRALLREKKAPAQFI